MGWQSEILDFWFSLEPEQWWKGDPELDAEIGELFGALWEEQRQKVAADFLTGSREALAAVILFDQVPRNMHRGHADQFSTDHLALAVAKGAVDRDYDQALGVDERVFLYMPFQHSEDMDDQRRSLTLFTALGSDYHLRYARLHHDIVDRFGRFPHRNEMLGRKPTEAEREAGPVFPW